jgi:hypothetical protein
VEGHSEERFLGSDVFESNARNLPPPNGTGTVREDARDIAVYHKCDVAVIGGGPAGCAAAWAAAKAGADVTLVERYNCLGGLSTGGLVMWIDRMTDWHGNHVIQGYARHFIDRMPPEAVAGPPREDWGSSDVDKFEYWRNRTTAFHGIVQWAPTIDPERMKLNNQEMLLEAGVRIVFHAWAARPLVEDGAARGVIFESKMGRHALLAKVVVDTTGDGDMFARAGADFDTDIEEGDVHHSMNTGWVLGGVNMDRWIDWKAHHPDELRQFMERGRAELGYFQTPYVSWRPDIALFLGPRQSGLSALDVDDLGIGDPFCPGHPIARSKQPRCGVQALRGPIQPRAQGLFALRGQRGEGRLVALVNALAGIDPGEHRQRKTQPAAERDIAEQSADRCAAP